MRNLIIHAQTCTMVASLVLSQSSWLVSQGCVEVQPTGFILQDLCCAAYSSMDSISLTHPTVCKNYGQKISHNVYLGSKLVLRTMKMIRSMLSICKCMKNDVIQCLVCGTT
ncbi:hypothetical protein RRG08_045234 [Elysia crispata]|uniref:Secreted protein n=1 Tax=Elysia crispata TaxID=231223 RepID=A0AAE1DRZ3_9GAST|nr:hypothetical protein RRG08_045234 [Elysia crispata]